ncbi:protein abrupt [Nilaparvata lugens]|uniref:protein abrupt n=1 Tax=Nilaparvata lugens TaxID=108931 RepID=UPI000B988A28|nr:protein abrupt [Nilaparvata lugens]XP_039292186.1 protein abrupt [Nilaparvata lugens]XP_039292187.1 protein abrupt [Nilaparvata lugens]XP_039292188.1 protein abrupt [Nilaparvata lugens]
MADEQLFCLRWNNFPNNFASQFDSLRSNEDFVDVTLTCEGRRITAHKLVLSACSPYFKQLFKGNPCKHPIMFLHNVEFQHLKALVDFMYLGEVNVAQTNLPSFLHTAETLQIRGLADSQSKFADINRNSTCGINAVKVRCGGEGGGAGGGGGSHIGPSTTEEAEDIITNALTNSHKRLKPNGSRSSLDSIAPNLHPKLEKGEFSAADLLESATAASAAVNPFLALESAVENVHSSGLTLQGALDAATTGGPHPAAVSQTHHSDQSVQEQSSSSDGEMAKPHSLDPRPCPECGRIYSNISNLRQHIRLIHYPECIACPLCFKPFKNKLYLKRHLISYHELLPPSYMEKRYQYNSGGGPGAVGGPGNSNHSNTPMMFPNYNYLNRHSNADQQPLPPTNNNHANFSNSNHMPVQAVLSSPPPNNSNYYQQHSTPRPPEYSPRISDNASDASQEQSTSLKRSYPNSQQAPVETPQESNNTTKEC